MPFTNEVIGTNGVLIRNWLQSANYQAGISGWQITKDGAAEFNNGTFRGSIEVGSLTGQHFIVNNATTGDVIDIYDTSNRLIYKLSASGQIISQSYVGSNAYVAIDSGSISFGDTLIQQLGTVTIGEGPGFTELRVSSPVLSGGRSVDLELISESTGNSYVLSDQRNVTGTLIQNDTINSNQLFHAGSYNGTTDASGNLVINHGASFTPIDAVITGTAHGGSFANLTWGYDGANATQFTTNWTIANTGAAWASRFITFSALFWG
jgi:hypothetical protein